MPVQYRDSVQSLVKYSAQELFVSNLVYASRDASGHVQFGQAVQNRPWEWIENLGDPPAVDRKEQQKEIEEKERLKTKYLVRNNASVSLDLFGARLTGEGIVRGTDEEVGATKLFEDNLTSESVFERDWRESRIELGDDHLVSRSRDDEEEEGGLSIMGPAALANRMARTTTPRRASPAPSAHSRSSANASNSASSRRQSPALGRLPGRPASREPIDVDSINITPTTGSKRAASAASIGDDDEVMLIEGPTVTTRSTAKRGKAGKTASKTRAKKK